MYQRKLLRTRQRLPATCSTRAIIIDFTREPMVGARPTLVLAAVRFVGPYLLG
jgi:hypothetical protein